MVQVDQQMAQDLLEALPLIYKHILFVSENDAAFSSLPSTQIQALVALKSETSLSMSMLSQRLHVSKQQMTKVVDALVRKGLAQRLNLPYNRRVVMVELTEAGEQEIIRICSSVTTGLQEHLAKLSSTQRKTVLDAFRILKNLLRESF